jgi:nitrogen regulatory protein P-II 1
MRRVDVLLPPAKLDEVKEGLADIGVDSMTMAEVRAVDPAHHRREVYRGSAYVVDFALKVKMELVVQDHLVPRIIAVLANSLGIAEAEAARVILSEVVEVVPIRIDHREGDAHASLWSAEP